MPPAKCPKSTQDVRKTAQHLHGAAANSRPTGTQGASPSKHALYALKFLAARKNRMRCAAGGEAIARENARERTVHDARRAPSPRTAARIPRSAYFFFISSRKPFKMKPMITMTMTATMTGIVQLGMMQPLSSIYASADS